MNVKPWPDWNEHKNKNIVKRSFSLFACLLESQITNPLNEHPGFLAWKAQKAALVNPGAILLSFVPQKKKQCLLDMPYIEQRELTSFLENSNGFWAKCSLELRYTNIQFRWEHPKWNLRCLRVYIVRMGRVAHVCNPSTLGGWGRQITWRQEFETSLASMAKLCLYYEIQKLARCGRGPL